MAEIARRHRVVHQRVDRVETPASSPASFMRASKPSAELARRPEGFLGDADYRTAVTAVKPSGPRALAIWFSKDVIAQGIGEITGVV